MIEAFAIRKKSTGEYWSSTGGKKVFTTIGAAKSAWLTSSPWFDKDRKPFNEQDEYEIVRLVPEESKYALSKCKIMIGGVDFTDCFTDEILTISNESNCGEV